MDFERTIQPAIERVSKGFPILLLTGMRQIGIRENMARFVSQDYREP